MIEIVTRPDFHDPVEVSEFLKELQRTLRYNHISDADLEKGQMRCDVNISLAPDNSSILGTRVELKNINSFGAIRRAIVAETERQTQILSQGGNIDQETRRRDDTANQSISMRSKADALDYRYFPDPDLPKMNLSEIEEFTSEALKASLPELPGARRARYLAYGLKEEDVAYLVDGGVRSSFMDQLFIECKEDQALIRQAVNYLVSDVAGWYTKSEKEEYEDLSVPAFAELMQLVVEGSLSSRGAKDVLALMLEGDTTSPKKLAEDKGLIQVSDPEALKATVQEVLAQNPEAIAQYKSGKESALQFLVGQAMKATRGAGNPATLKTLLEEGLAT